MQMSSDNSECKKIDFLQLSEPDKIEFIKELKEVLREKVEEARFLRSHVE